MISLDECPTCHQQWLVCGSLHPQYVADVEPVRCQLPRGHHSSEHYHRSLWPGMPDLLWEDPHMPDPGFAQRQVRRAKAHR